MAGEGGQALLDALFVADVREDIPVDGDLAARVGRDMETGLGHHGQKAAGLEGHGLSARVGTGDDQSREVLSQRHVDGHAGRRVKQRMSGPSKIQDTVLADLRFFGVHVQSQFPLGVDQIQFHEDLLVVGQSLVVLRGAFRKLP